MPKQLSPESILSQLRQRISADHSACGLLEALTTIELFAEPHRTDLARLWLAQWRRCAEEVGCLRSTLRAELPSQCDRCGASSDTLVPIAYGYPESWIEAAQDRGEVSHRGCLWDEGAPAWLCLNCGREQGRSDPSGFLIQRRSLREFASLPDTLVQRCSHEWKQTLPLPVRDICWRTPTSPAFVRMVDRIACCTTTGELEARVPEIQAFDEQFRTPSSEYSWQEMLFLVVRSDDPTALGRHLYAAIESLRSIWWMAWRAHGGVWAAVTPEPMILGGASAITEIVAHLNRLRSQLGPGWESLAHLVEDAAQGQHIGRLQVAVEAIDQWRREQELDVRRAQWSESLLRLQENADRLARMRITSELSASRSSVTWEALAHLIDHGLRSGEVATLRVASIASTVWEEKWWEWWEDPASFLLASLQGIDREPPSSDPT